MKKSSPLALLERLDGNRLSLPNPQGVPVTIFANEQVPIEAEAVTELLSLLELQDTLRLFGGSLERISVTPDFHKGAGIPIGTVIQTQGSVIPAAVGNDVNCGMRLHATNLTADRVRAKLDPLEKRLRHLYFEGGRNIPMTREQRESLLLNGLEGLRQTVPKSQTEGQWGSFHRFIDQDIGQVENNGSYEAHTTKGLDDFLGAVRDGQIASIGGGNHHVEIQEVVKILDPVRAHAWGIGKPGTVVVMVHSGSVAIGHLAGSLCKDLAKKAYPKSLKHPTNGLFVLPINNLKDFWDHLYNAANFAFGNRMFLALLALEALEAECGGFKSSLVRDAPHNLVWPQGQDTFVHRKGACPADPEKVVLVPGSMGASSYVMVGLGNAESLNSSSHGAGRSISRGKALKISDAELQKFMQNFRVVTPVDFNRQDIKMRRDITSRKLEEIKQELPSCYKGILPVTQTLTDAGLASPVVELRPLMTVKG